MPKKHVDVVPPNAGGSERDAASADLPTLAGAVPAGLEKLFRTVQAPSLPEVCRLPAPGERCVISGASRTWLIETHERARREGRGFLFRVRQPGKLRGACFINTQKLLAFLRAEEAADEAVKAAEEA